MGGGARPPLRHARQGGRRPLSAGLDVILDIDVNGALKVKEELADAVLIFIDTPSVAELERRLAARGRRR